MSPLLHRLFTVKPPRALRAVLLLAVYSAILGASLWASYQLRFEFAIPEDQLRLLAQASFWLIPLALGLLWLRGQFRSLLSYFSVPDLTRIAESQVGVYFIAIVIWYGTRGLWAPPRSVLAIHLVGSITGVAAFRLGLRLMRERYSQSAPRLVRGTVRRVAIIGATDICANLVKEMKYRPESGMAPIAIFDEDQRRIGRQIHGVPILGSYELLLSPQNALHVSEVIIAQTDVGQARLRGMVRELVSAGLICNIAPSGKIVGANHRQEIRPIEIEDLLGREAVDLETDQIQQLIAGRCILISGAGGSIGSELCRLILGYSPRRLVLLEQCEAQLFGIEQELLQAHPAAILSSCVADILDEARVQAIFRHYSPDIVFHAAAHKHVPMMEHQPAEAFQNNVVGTMRLAEAARQHGCDRFVLISSDKAINPTSVMGATKRLAEIYLQALPTREHSRTKFIAVRFGNVLGSSGSVIPTFKRQIAEGGPVTVTHPEVTRYFMVIREAVGLVLQSATQGAAGEILVLDMGAPVKIMDLARQTIELSGLRPEIDIEIKVTGLRPGEKLFEELNHSTENNAPTHHTKIMRFVGQPAPLDSLSIRLQELHERSHALGVNEMKMEIQKLVPEYQPYLSSKEESPPSAAEPISSGQALAKKAG